MAAWALATNFFPSETFWFTYREALSGSQASVRASVFLCDTQEEVNTLDKNKQKSRRRLRMLTEIILEEPLQSLAAAVATLP